MIFECEKSLPVVNVYILWEAHFVEFLVCGNGHPNPSLGPNKEATQTFWFEITK